MVPDHLQVPGPAHGLAQEEPWEEKAPLGAAQEAPSIWLQPQETQPFPESGEEQDSVGRERSRREYKGHIAVLRSWLSSSWPYYSYLLGERLSLFHHL